VTMEASPTPTGTAQPRGARSILEMPNTKVLVVDDEAELTDMLTSYLEASGFTVGRAATGEGALTKLETFQPDLVVLDIGLPDIDGFEVLRRLRATSSTPVIMLTARAEEVDRVVGLTMGADDYVTKPFSPRELVARIGAVLRRASIPEEPAERWEFADFTIDLAQRTVTVGDREVELSQLEFDLLAALASAPKRVFTREQLLEQVWGWDHFGVDRVVDVHISNIRKALGDSPSDPRIIATVRGVGYKLISEPR